MICEFCGKKGARERRVTRSYGRGGNLLVIEKVPVITCPHCGESYLTATTLHELERIKRHRKELVARRPVTVANSGKLPEGSLTLALSGPPENASAHPGRTASR